MKITERAALNTIKAEGWTQIDPRGRKNPSPFIRRINGVVCEAYGHFKKGDALVAVACTDKRWGATQEVYARRISNPADFTGERNRWAEDLEDLRDILRDIEDGR